MLLSHVINRLLKFLKGNVKELDTLYIWSDGCSSQLRSRFVFKSLLSYPRDIKICWDYGEVSHFKGPHDGIGGTVKRSTYRAVQSEKVVINTAREFAEAASKYSQIKVLYVDKTEIKYPDIDAAKAVQGTLQVHHIERQQDGVLVFKKNSPYRSTDELAEPVFRTVDYSANDVETLDVPENLQTNNDATHGDDEQTNKQTGKIQKQPEPEKEALNSFVSSGKAYHLLYLRQMLSENGTVLFSVYVNTKALRRRRTENISSLAEQLNVFLVRMVVW